MKPRGLDDGEAIRRPDEPGGRLVPHAVVHEERPIDRDVEPLHHSPRERLVGVLRQIGELHLGAMASSYGDVAVMLELGGLGREDLHHAFLAAAAQWWPDPWERFWLRGGIGIGSEGADVEPHRDAAYPTVLAATGFEVVRSDRFTVDLQAQGVATFVPHRTGRSLSVNVGFNWY